MILQLKKIIEKIPYSLGSKISHIPFQYRLGKDYSVYQRIIDQIHNSSEDEKINFVIDRFKMIFDYSKKNIEFYKNIYKEKDVIGINIKYLDDIKKIPVLTKKELRNYTKMSNGYLLLNTGGTSGQPFSFYIDKGAFAREWAHMHYIWRLKGYHQTDLKITLRGKNIPENILYNPIHNEFIINTYRKPSDYKKEFINLIKRRKIKFIHGYPSAIYSFLKEVDECFIKSEKELFAKNIKSCLFGSEFPAPYITDYIKNTWDFDFISWYGHSEMCILAYDINKNNTYRPFYTYGFVEAENNFLIGTSYNNFDMPLIRYNTEDIVENQNNKSGLLESFKISEGRVGDFILDKDAKRIPLTGLIYGRHHEIFNIADHIQVSQIEKGQCTLYITLSNDYIDKIRLREMLDLSNINIDFDIKTLTKPILTSSGKLKLKID